MGYETRNSNIETLRIISMAMILMLHFVGATFGLPTHAQLLDGDPVAIAKALVEAAAIVGVNCFVLISGYYGIRATWRGAFGYLFMCEFAALSVYVARCIDRGGLADGLCQTLMVLSDTNLWFVPAYFVLYLLSPILNGGFAALHGRRLHLMLGVLAFINIYLGWYHGGRINQAGYSIMHLIFIYFIGYYISRNASVAKHLPPTAYLLVYGIAVCATALSLNYAYNNPPCHIIFYRSVLDFCHHASATLCICQLDCIIGIHGLPAAQSALLLAKAKPCVAHIRSHA